MAVVVSKPAGPTVYATAELFIVTPNGDLIVLDSTYTVLATALKGAYGTVRNGANT